jgi:hypothetical protein
MESGTGKSYGEDMPETAHVMPSSGVLGFLWRLSWLKFQILEDVTTPWSEYSKGIKMYRIL